MAEAVFADLVKKNHLLEKIEKIDSAGTSGYHIGDYPDPRTIHVCKVHNVPIDHVGRQVCPKDFEEFDWILVMDQENLQNVLRVKPSNVKAQIQLLGHFDPEGDLIIKDPYYGGEDGFERNFKQVFI
jgi:low molecular weight phosphotyrosine protein phosphatase